MMCSFQQRTCHSLRPTLCWWAVILGRAFTARVILRGSHLYVGPQSLLLPEGPLQPKPRETGLSRERQQQQLGFQTLYYASVFNISAPEYFPCSLVRSALPFEASAAMQRGQMLCCRRLHIVCTVCLNGESRFLPRNEMTWWHQDWNRLETWVGQVLCGQPLICPLEYYPGPCAGVCDPASFGAYIF